MQFRCLAAFVFVLFLGGVFVQVGREELAAQSSTKSDTVAQVIIPFVNKHCVDCHGPKKKKADLALHVYKDEKSILKDRKRWNEVLQMVHAGEMPPEKRPRPDAKDAEAFQKAIHGIFAAADRNAKPDPGRVTMRRLNRTEYNNTIRDLVGVDFKPAEDFPFDDVGYGFDNIGDVLTISPLLMERYLAAAEIITQQAILVGDPPKAPTRTVSARFTEPAVGRPDSIGRFRAITVTKVPLMTTHVLTQDGEYTARVRGYGKQAGNEPVKMAVLVDGKQQKVFEIKSKNDKDVQSLEIKIELKKGVHRVAAVLLNEYKEPLKEEPKKDQPKESKKDPAKTEARKDQKTSDSKTGGRKEPPPGERAFMLEQFQMIGPLDTRPPSHRKIMAHAEGLSQREAAREIVTRFASQAYRRPATKEEVERLLKFVDQAEKNKDRWEVGIQLAVQAVLCSPKFLFRVELDQRPDSPSPHPIDEYQLASRLSYFLWSSMPDEELCKLAAAKQLHQNLEAQVKRMLRDDKSRALVENFAAQWLQIRILKNFSPDPKLFPDFDESLRSAMAQETELFFEAIVKEDHSILDIIDSKFSFMNERLARHYGIADTNGNRLYQKAKTKAGQQIPRSQFVRVTFADDERGGVLTQASVLAVTSNPTRTSPVKRGRWVLEQILGTPPPPPPPNVPELVEKGELKGTLRERMEQHRKDPSCANCHARMDPIGFAFENYSAIGKFRLKDGETPIDSSGVLPGGQTFKGPKELKQILMGKKDLFSRALTEKMLTYSIGRGLEFYDKPAVDRIVSALAKNDFRFSTLMVEIAKSDPFRMRRGKDQTE